MSLMSYMYCLETPSQHVLVLMLRDGGVLVTCIFIASLIVERIPGDTKSVQQYAVAERAVSSSIELRSQCVSLIRYLMILSQLETSPRVLWAIPKGFECFQYHAADGSEVSGNTYLTGAHAP
jgi:hypothetical protein